MQVVAVSLIVAVAAAYAAWLLMPQNVRRWLIDELMVIAPSHRAWLVRLQANAENSGCSSCKERRREGENQGASIHRG